MPKVKSGSALYKPSAPPLCLDMTPPKSLLIARNTPTQFGQHALCSCLLRP